MIKKNKKPMPNCLFLKKPRWWNIFQDWNDCTHPESKEIHGGENGICFWKRHNQTKCPRFKPKSDNNAKDC